MVLMYMSRKCMVLKTPKTLEWSYLSSRIFSLEMDVCTMANVDINDLMSTPPEENVSVSPISRVVAPAALRSSTESDIK